MASPRCQCRPARWWTLRRGSVADAAGKKPPHHHLAAARLSVIHAERIDPNCSEQAIAHILLAMDFIKPGAIARLVSPAEDER